MVQSRLVASKDRPGHVLPGAALAAWGRIARKGVYSAGPAGSISLGIYGPLRRQQDEAMAHSSNTQAQIPNAKEIIHVSADYWPWQSYELVG